MTRFFDDVGYSLGMVETPAGSGVWKDTVVVRKSSGDVVRNASSSQSGEGLNNDILVSNTISIVADEYAVSHFSKIKYVRCWGELWSVTNVDASKPPRLILSLGGVYNGPTPT